MEEVEKWVFAVASVTLFALSAELVLPGMWLAFDVHPALAVASGAAAILCFYAALACFDRMRVCGAEVWEVHCFMLACVGAIFAYGGMLACMGLGVPPDAAAKLALTATPSLGFAAASALALAGSLRGRALAA